MRHTFKPATARTATLSLALLLILSASAARAARGRVAVVEPALAAANTLAVPLADQSGYRAQVVARDAAVRARPGGQVVGKLANGQWFHVYPSYKGNPAWLSGYMCPHGNRESLPGFILHSVPTGARAAGQPSAESYQVAGLTASDDPFAVEDVRFLPASFGAGATLYGIVPAQGSERRICSEQVWMRNDRLRPIRSLYRNERFRVERYADGSKDDGKRRWAIGRAHGIQGRVPATSLCP
jgi:hypothetical protein